MTNQIIYKERRNTSCAKWDDMTPNFGQEGLHAMWVADMDFEVPACIKKALSDYLDHGVFGYYRTPSEYYRAFLDWEETYHGYKVKREWIRFAPGVVPAINWWIQLLTVPQDAVIVLTPVYYPFLHAISDNGRRLIPCDLLNDHGSYTIDFEAFEESVVKNNVKLFILSSPHNPVGRVWTKEELTRLMDICQRYGVYVLSDEIHQDVTFADAKHHPTATLGDYDSFLITLTAASKTFNLAACQNSFVIIPDEKLRATFDSFAHKNRIEDGNSFGYIAVAAALAHGRPWFEEVKKIIDANAAYVRDAFSASLPHVEISPLQGTYLLWMNFAAYLKPEEVKDFMQKKCGLAFDYGDWFGGDQYRTFIRMNLATSPESVKKATDAIIAQLAG